MKHPPHHDRHDGPPHHHPPHHHHHHHHPRHPHHAPHRRSGRAEFFAEPIAGVIRRLLEVAEEIRDAAELEALLSKRAPADLTHYQVALRELAEAGREPIPEKLLLVMACNKSVRRLEEIKLAALRQNEGNGSTPRDGEPSTGGFRAAILPLPPRVEYIVDEAERVFVLPHHPVPHHLEDLEPMVLPTRTRHVRELFAGVTQLAFEGAVDREGRVKTREEIVDLLTDLAEAGARPKILLHVMNHQPPPHENWAAIETDNPWSEI